MTKTILITGSTDGIGFETAKMLVSAGHTVIAHGRNPAKLDTACAALSALPGAGEVGGFTADLSSMTQTAELADRISAETGGLDVLINNAGVYALPEARTVDELDARFAVNTIAPYLLSVRLLPLLGTGGRVLNLSSAAQAPVDLAALAGAPTLSDHAAYAQSKLALTMWSGTLARRLGPGGPVILSVNPGSLLGSKMVKDAFGMEGGDLRIGADILTRLATEEAFANTSGQYFDNDAGRFGPPHADALDAAKSQAVEDAVKAVLARLGHPV